MSVLPSRAGVVRPPRHDLGQRSVAYLRQTLGPSTDGVRPKDPVSRLYRALRRWSDCQVSRTAFGAGPRRLANFGFLRLILVLPSNSLPILRKSPIIPPAPPRLDRSLLSITIDNDQSL